jgi:adenine-specific DNA methylase
VGGCNPGTTDGDLRKALLRFIADFANWDNAANRTYLDVSRALVKAAHGEEPPLVVDPFAGGGSIPLEALRLGCDAFASDLNPVACLILKVMLEDIPRHGPKIAEELRRVGAEIKRQAEKELADLYPKDPDGATPIAYLWARTVRCEAPNCGAEIPLARSFWLCKKANRKRALSHSVARRLNETPHVEFEVFEPKSEKDVPGGTVTRAKATCVACGAVLPPERVRPQLAAQRGGADVVFDAKGRRTGGARMLAVVTLKPGEQGRHYRLPTERDYESVGKSQLRIAEILSEWERGGKQGLSPVPDETISLNEIRRISVPIYGMTSWGDLFPARQKLALATLARVARERPGADGDAVRAGMAIVVDRCADYWSSLCSWHLTGEKVNHTFGRQALPMIWDYCEVYPFSCSSGNYDGALEWVVRQS